MLHKPTLKRKNELWEVRDGLAKPEVQPILSGIICFVLLQVGSFGVVQHVGGRSQTCVSYAWEISPTLILVPVYLIKEKQRRKQTRALPVWAPGSLNHFIIIAIFILFLLLLLYYYYYYIIIIIILLLLSISLLLYIFLFVHQTLYTQTRPMYGLQNKPSLDLSPL